MILDKWKKEYYLANNLDPPPNIVPMRSMIDNDMPMTKKDKMNDQTQNDQSKVLIRKNEPDG